MARSRSTRSDPARQTSLRSRFSRRIHERQVRHEGQELDGKTVVAVTQQPLPDLLEDKEDITARIFIPPCAVCKIEPATLALVPCGHLCLCISCERDIHVVGISGPCISGGRCWNFVFCPVCREWGHPMTIRFTRLEQT